MNAYSTHRSAIWMSVVMMCLLSATAVFADGPGPKPPKDYPPKKPPVERPSPPEPPPSPQVTQERPKPPQEPPAAGPVNTRTPPPQLPKDNLWWWISAGILLLLLLFFLYWILRRRDKTGYTTPPSKPTGPAYPPVDQSPQQRRPDQY